MADLTVKVVVLRVLAALLALGGGINLLVWGFAWGFPGPEWGFPGWLQVLGIVLFFAALPIVAVAIAAFIALDSNHLRPGNDTTPAEYRIRPRLLPEMGPLLTRWLGPAAWLILAGGYGLTLFEVNIFPVSLAMLAGAVSCIIVAGRFYRKAEGQ